MDGYLLRSWIATLIGAMVLRSLMPAASPTVYAAPAAPLSALWTEPTDLAERDLFHGPWGAAKAPDPNAVYTFVRAKLHGANPGVVVRDANGREWHVKQEARNIGFEAPAEVTLSRILSAVGYHQPPIYFLPSFTMTTASGTGAEPGGRFRLVEPALHDRGEWSWQSNPFVDRRQYAGLLVILVMFNSSDLKNSNNSLYEVARGNGIERWYVVRDIGSSLGETSRYRPRRNDVQLFERSGFIRGVSPDGFVEFEYRGKNTDLLRRITPADVGWASALLDRLSATQWNDAFRAGGYPPETAARYIAVLRNRIIQGRELADGEWARKERR
jgi:hypothetical protein